MSVESVLTEIFCGILQSIAISIIIFKQISSFSKIDKLFLIFIMWIYCVFSLLFIPNYLRFILFIIYITLILYFVFKIKDKKVILYAFNVQVIFAIAEIITTLFMLIFGFDINDSANNVIFTLLISIFTSSISIFIINLSIINKFIKLMIELFTKNKKLLNYLIIFLIIIYIIILKNGLELLLKSNYYINIVFIIGIAIIVYIFVKNELKTEQLQEMNDQMVNHVTKYERIITEQGKANHEFKNQLMVIRGYAQMNSPKLIEYIDSIIQDSRKTTSSYLTSQLNKFPVGGIKGLLYYKLSIMDDEKIKYQLDVGDGVKTKLDALSTKAYRDITRILGVLFDNAIDASKSSKEKRILITVVKEKFGVSFTVSNTYKGKIIIEKIGTGYTTKGKGHGYGLRLVEDIINSNNNLSLEKNLDKENKIYSTTLNIKIRNKRTKKC